MVLHIFMALPALSDRNKHVWSHNCALSPLLTPMPSKVWYQDEYCFNLLFPIKNRHRLLVLNASPFILRCSNKLFSYWPTSTEYFSAFRSPNYTVHLRMHHRWKRTCTAHLQNVPSRLGFSDMFNMRDASKTSFFKDSHYPRPRLGALSFPIRAHRWHAVLFAIGSSISGLRYNHFVTYKFEDCFYFGYVLRIWIGSVYGALYFTSDWSTAKALQSSRGLFLGSRIRLELAIYTVLYKKIPRYHVITLIFDKPTSAFFSSISFSQFSCFYPIPSVQNKAQNLCRHLIIEISLSTYQSAAFTTIARLRPSIFNPSGYILSRLTI